MNNPLGANWKTSVSMIGGVFMAALTWLANVSYESGPISMVVPVKYKGTVTLIAGIAALVLFIWNGIQQKSKNVTGGSVAQTMSGAVAREGTQSLVDATVRTTLASGEEVTPTQERLATS